MFAASRDTIPNINLANPGKQTNRIIIRCSDATAFQGQPLYIVDGVPYDFLDLKTLDPSKILSICVLKSSQATALCDSKAFCGIIIIATKRGNHLIIQDEENKNLLKGASVKISSNTKLKKPMFFAADENGEVDLSPLENEHEYQIEISCIGYKTKINNIKKRQQNYYIQLEKDYKLLDTVILTTDMSSRKISCGITCLGISPYGSRNSKNENKFAFEIYPNPVNTSSTVRLKLSQAVNGKIAIISSSGQIIHSENFNSNKTSLQDIDLKKVSAGVYFIKLTDIFTRKSITQKLIIQ